MRIYAARVVLPISSPPVESGAIAVQAGKIVAAGQRQDVLTAHGAGAEIRDLGDVAVLPGLVNAHTHLELSGLADPPLAGGDYTEWVGELLARRGAEDTAAAQAAAEREIRGLVDRGTVAVGDVANRTWIVPLLARSGLHGIVFHELYGLRNADAERSLQEAVDRLEALARDPDVTAAAGRLRVALTPHAPHSTSVQLIKALAGRSAATGDPLSIHVAESQAEVQLLRDGSGPLAQSFRDRGFWDPEWKPPALSPVEYLHRIGVLSSRTLAVHAIHLDHQDVSQLQAARATVVTCPRSNARLGVGRAPIPKLLSAGVPVALGTDSLASAPDLDLFAEIAALRGEHPTLSAAAVLRMATLNGARALGLASLLGTIEPGKLADLVVVPLAGSNALELVCSNPQTVFRLASAPWEPAA